MSTRKYATLFLLFLFLITALQIPTMKLPETNLHTSAQPEGYVSITVVPNETKPVSVWLSNGFNSFDDCLTINQMGILNIVKGRGVLLVSKYPFAVNGQVARYIQAYQGYLYPFIASQSETLYVDFLPKPTNAYAIDLKTYSNYFAFLNIHLNESKNITVWLVAGGVGFYYTTINSSTVIPVLKGTTLNLYSPYPFEVNGEAPSENNVYCLVASSNTTLNINFINQVKHNNNQQATSTAVEHSTNVVTSTQISSITNYINAFYSFIIHHILELISAGTNFINIAMQKVAYIISNVNYLFTLLILVVFILGLSIAIKKKR